MMGFNHALLYLVRGKTALFKITITHTQLAPLFKYAVQRDIFFAYTS